MNIPNELAIVTADLAAARQALANSQTQRVHAIQRLTQAEELLAVSRTALMARSDAGGNDHQRRAYADRETANERDDVGRLRANAALAEIAVIEDTAALRVLEDRRRYLETVATLAANSATELAIHASYADNGDGAPVGAFDNGGHIGTRHDDDLPF